MQTRKRTRLKKKKDGVKSVLACRLSSRASVVGLLATAPDWWGLWTDMRAFGSHTGQFLVMKKETCGDEENSFLV